MTNAGPVVAFQGAPGAYSEEAVHRIYGPATETLPLRENKDVTRAIADGRADLGLLPIENTLAGAVLASYDAMLAEPDLHAIGEVVLPIHHCVLGLSGSSLASLRVVESHPIALAQCESFFAQHPELQPRAVYDTAGAASDIALVADITRGAIASREAARRYGLVVLAADVEDRPDNQTRFLVLSRTRARLPDGQRARTLLALTVDNKPGGLLRVLTPLAEHGLNLVRLESRPTREPWTYWFVVEFEHQSGDAAADVVLAEIARVSHSFRAIGTYPAAIETISRRG
jgi:prephenate dehydratase